MITRPKKKFMPYLVMGLLLFYAGHWVMKLFQEAPKGDALTDPLELSRLDWISQHYQDKSWLDLSFTLPSLYLGGIGFAVVLFHYLKRTPTGVYRVGEEHGSARFATTSEMKTFEDSEVDNNMIFTQNAKMGLFNKRMPFHRQINKNALVVGGTGDWKTRSFVKPNLLQLNSSFITTDTKGLIVHEVGHALEKAGYEVKVFNLLNFTNSDQFNVFHYMTKETDIDKVAEAIVQATKKSDNSGEDFWAQAEMLLMRALIGFLYFDSQWRGFTPNLAQVAELIRVMNRQDPKRPSVLERLFDELDEQIPNNYAVKQWKLFNKNFTGETRNSVSAIASARFSVFDHDDVKQLIMRDTLEIETWQLKKVAVFIHIPETDKAYQFLSALLFQTIFETNIRVADSLIMGEHPTHQLDQMLHLQIYGDEVAQVGKIPLLPEVMSVIRSREISAKLMIQSISQLQELYGEKNTKTIINNCGAILYLGTNDEDTLKWLSTRSGKQTINDRDSSRSYGQYGSSTVQEKKIARDLMTQHEISTVPIDSALLFLSRQNVYKDKKYDLATHPRFIDHANSPLDKDNWYTYQKQMIVEQQNEKPDEGETYFANLSDDTQHKALTGDEMSIRTDNGVAAYRQNHQTTE